MSSDIERLCEEADHYKFASVCLNPYWVKQAAARLMRSGVKVCTVIGFPLGSNVTAVKCFEAETALDDGAAELDMVMNIGAFLSGDRSVVRDEIAALASIAHSRAALLKVILETCLLSDDQKIDACRIAVGAGADFVKTSTGFAASGATAADVSLMRRTVENRAGVKASGGVRSLQSLREMVDAGASRIGTSSGVLIMRELQQGSLAGTAGRLETGSAGY